MDDYEEIIINGSAVTAIATLLLIACSADFEEPFDDRPIRQSPGRMRLPFTRWALSAKSFRRKKVPVLEDF